MWRFYYTANNGYLGMEMDNAIDLNITECSEAGRKKAAKKALEWVKKFEKLEEERSMKKRFMIGYRDFTLRYLAAASDRNEKFIEQLKRAMN